MKLQEKDLNSNWTKDFKEIIRNESKTYGILFEGMKVPYEFGKYERSSSKISLNELNNAI